MRLFGRTVQFIWWMDWLWKPRWGVYYPVSKPALRIFRWVAWGPFQIRVFFKGNTGESYGKRV